MKEKQIILLRDMKERLFEKGWKKGSVGPKDGPNCIMGAWHFVSTIGESSNAEAVRELLNDLCGVARVVAFNDHEDTSFDDIVDLIDLAIKTLEME